MSVTFVQGDIFQTSAQAVAFGLNSTGRLDVSPLAVTLQDRYPVFLSDYRKQAHAGLLPAGQIWIWRESAPWLVGLVIRESPQGAIRLRYVEAALLNLYKNWERESLRSLAITRLADDPEWPTIRDLLRDYLGGIKLAVSVYES
jgi:O-acetyl-ADP-ribose deacetylase (regulator of RNase III)